jgi:hypothetical protein
VFRYDEEEWSSLIADAASSWSRAETDYLLAMVEQFDQRFIVIADRWDVSDTFFPGRRLKQAPGRTRLLLSRCHAIGCSLVAGPSFLDALPWCSITHHIHSNRRLPSPLTFPPSVSRGPAAQP